MGPSYDLLHWYGWKNFLRDWNWREMWQDTVRCRRRVWQLQKALEEAVNWNDEYKRINNLSGDPYWVEWAREVLRSK